MKEKQVLIQNPGTYLFGEAPVHKHPKSIKISGRLSAPFDFLEKKDKETQYNVYYSHLIIDKDKMSLELHLDEKSPHCEDIITGSLSEDAQLSDWSINSEKRWSVKDFIKFLRARKYFFKDPSQHGKLIESLQKWNISFERVIQEENNNSGNSISKLETKVSEASLNTKFTLSIPIYKGYEKCEFDVEIGFDPKSASVDLFLVSSELFELKMIERDRIFKSELTRFSKIGFDCSTVHIS